MVLRVVVDTNVLISFALFRSSTPGRAVDHVIASAVMLTAPALAQEALSVIARPKFDRIRPLDARVGDLDLILAAAEFIPDPPAIPPTCRDPDDDLVLATAVAGGADLIISGDADLLALGAFRGIPILSAAAFLEGRDGAG